MNKGSKAFVRTTRVDDMKATIANRHFYETLAGIAKSKMYTKKGKFIIKSFHTFLIQESLTDITDSGALTRYANLPFGLTPKAMAFMQAVR